MLCFDNEARRRPTRRPRQRTRRPRSHRTRRTRLCVLFRACVQLANTFPLIPLTQVQRKSLIRVAWTSTIIRLCVRACAAVYSNSITEIAAAMRLVVCAELHFRLTRLSRRNRRPPRFGVTMPLKSPSSVSRISSRSCATLATIGSGESIGITSRSLVTVWPRSSRNLQTDSATQWSAKNRNFGLAVRRPPCGSCGRSEYRSLSVTDTRRGSRHRRSRRR